MDTQLVAAGTAFWLGLLTSVSPCPLASNIAAISYIGKSIANPKRVLAAGVLYTLGRVLAYAVAGVAAGRKRCQRRGTLELPPALHESTVGACADSRRHVPA